VLPPLPRRRDVWLLRAIQQADRLRLRWLAARHPGLQIDPAASTNLAHAHYELGPGARLSIAAGVVTERRAGALRFLLGPGATIEVGPGAWLRTDLGPVVLACFEGARMVLGPESFLNAAHLSAKRSLVLGRRAWVGPGSRVFDSDQHDFDADRLEEARAVVIGDYVWVASDCTVLKGVTLGAHAVIGARSLVTRDVPPHTLAFGQPAVARGTVGDRSRVR
jgi:acetyltransferase-like isoleucine patch superfamily enzyme